MAVMAEGGTPVRDLAWLLDDLADRVPDFRRAVILSRDGLLIAASKDLSREDGEHLSAVAAAVQSLAAGTGDRFAAGRAGGAINRAQADAGTVAYEMAMLVKRARPHLAALPRNPATEIPVE